MANTLLGHGLGWEGGVEVKKEGQDNFWTWQRDYTRKFLVYSDSIYTLEDDVIKTAGVAQIGQTIGNAYCISAKAVELFPVWLNGGVGMLWEVTCEFTTDIGSTAFEGSEGEEPEEPDPINLRPQRRWYGVEEMEAMEEDALGNAVVTEPGEKMAFECPRTYVILEIKRYEPYPFDPSVILDYSEHVNSSSFYGAPKGSALMLPIQSDEVEMGDWGTLCQVTYPIKFKLRKKSGTLTTDSWKAKLLHEGTMYRIAPGAAPIQARDQYKNPIRVNLNDNGTINTTDVPKYRTFTTFPEANFAALGLEF